MAPRPLQAPELAVAIGEVRRRTGMTSRAIRFYEDLGLIRTRRDARGLRCYDEAALDRLIWIGRVRRAGLTLAQIGELLSIAEFDGEAALAARTQDLFRARRLELQDQLQALEASAEALGAGLQTQRPQLVALRA